MVIFVEGDEVANCCDATVPVFAEAGATKAGATTPATKMGEDRDVKTVRRV